MVRWRNGVIIESLSTHVFEPGTSTGSFCSSFSTFSCLTNKLPSSRFSIYDFLFSQKSELYRSKRRSFDFRLTSVAQKRLCLSSLICKIYVHDFYISSWYVVRFKLPCTSHERLWCTQKYNSWLHRYVRVKNNWLGKVPLGSTAGKRSKRKGTNKKHRITLPGSLKWVQGPVKQA